MFFLRRRYFVNQYYDKVIYYDRKTRQVLEAPKSKLLDTEKSSRMNRHIPLLVVLFISSGGWLASFFSLLLQGTYTPTTFWTVIVLWLAEFAFITILVERALYKNIKLAQVTTQTIALYTIRYTEHENTDEEEETENGFSRAAFLYFNALLALVPAGGAYYAYAFIFHFNDLLGKPMGGEIFTTVLAGLLLGVAFVLFNQNNFVRILKLTQRFEEGKISIICRDDEDPERYLEVSIGPDEAVVTKEVPKN